MLVAIDVVQQRADERWNIHSKRERVCVRQRSCRCTG